jgi:hypothetical protein
MSSVRHPLHLPPRPAMAPPIRSARPRNTGGSRRCPTFGVSGGAMEWSGPVIGRERATRPCRP